MAISIFAIKGELTCTRNILFFSFFLLVFFLLDTCILYFQQILVNIFVEFTNALHFSLHYPRFDRGIQPTPKDITNVNYCIGVRGGRV